MDIEYSELSSLVLLLAADDHNISAVVFNVQLSLILNVDRGI